jgi:hypothetical protein
MNKDYPWLWVSCVMLTYNPFTKFCDSYIYIYIYSRDPIPSINWKVPFFAPSNFLQSPFNNFILSSYGLVLVDLASLSPSPIFKYCYKLGFCRYVDDEATYVNP